MGDGMRSVSGEVVLAAKEVITIGQEASTA